MGRNRKNPKARQASAPAAAAAAPAAGNPTDATNGTLLKNEEPAADPTLILQDTPPASTAASAEADASAAEAATTEAAEAAAAEAEASAPTLPGSDSGLPSTTPFDTDASVTPPPAVLKLNVVRRSHTDQSEDETFEEPHERFTDGTSTPQDGFHTPTFQGSAGGKFNPDMAPGSNGNGIASGEAAEKLRKQLEELEVRCRELEEGKRGSEVARKSLQRVKSSLEKDLVAANGKASKAEESEAAAKGEVVQLEGRVGAAESECASLKDAIAAKESEVVTLQQELVTVRREVDAAKGETGRRLAGDEEVVRALEKENWDLVSARDIALKECVETKKEVSDLTRSLGEKHHELQQLQQALAQATDGLARAEAALAAKTDELADQILAASVASSSASQLRCDLEALLAHERRERANEQTEHERERSEAHLKIGELETRVQALEGQLAASDAARRESDGLLEGKGVAAEQANRLASDTIARVQQLLSELSHAKQELAAAQDVIVTKEKERERAENRGDEEAALRKQIEAAAAAVAATEAATSQAGEEGAQRAAAEVAGLTERVEVLLGKVASAEKAKTEAEGKLSAADKESSRLTQLVAAKEADAKGFFHQLGQVKKERDELQAAYESASDKVQELVLKNRRMDADVMKAAADAALKEQGEGPLAMQGGNGWSSLTLLTVGVGAAAVSGFVAVRLLASKSG